MTMMKEEKLPEKIKLDIPEEKKPRHVAIILDGNRRLVS